ncbi:MAG: hypothetical protein K2H01_09195 [Ruminococcus sp.]|nr:hypothetical protein [Ruminococcus sp.]
MSRLKRLRTLFKELTSDSMQSFKTSRTESEQRKKLEKLRLKPALDVRKC